MSRVLIVDDEPGVRSSLMGVLRDEGYDVESAESGEACLDKAVRRAFDVIVLDIWLPGMDGLATLDAAARAPGGRAGGRHLGTRQHRVGGARDQDGRVRLRREAAVAREDGPRRSQRHPPAPSRSRESRSACPRRSPPDDGRRQLRDGAAARAGGDGGADKRPRAGIRRERHRQGAGGALHSRSEQASHRTLHRSELRGDSRRADRIRAVRPRPGRLHRRGHRPPRQVRSGRRRNHLPGRDW